MNLFCIHDSDCFGLRFSDQVIEQRTEMVSSSSSYTETSTKLGMGISQPKSPHGIVRNNIIAFLSLDHSEYFKYPQIFAYIENKKINIAIDIIFTYFCRDEVIQVIQLFERCNKHQ